MIIYISAGRHSSRVLPTMPKRECQPLQAGIPGRVASSAATRHSRASDQRSNPARRSTRSQRPPFRRGPRAGRRQVQVSSSFFLAFKNVKSGPLFNVPGFGGRQGRPDGQARPAEFAPFRSQDVKRGGAACNTGMPFDPRQAGGTDAGGCGQSAAADIGTHVAGMTRSAGRSRTGKRCPEEKAEGKQQGRDARREPMAHSLTIMRAGSGRQVTFPRGIGGLPSGPVD